MSELRQILKKKETLYIINPNMETIYKETHTVRGVPVRIISEQGLKKLLGIKVDVHMHTPATKVLGRPIFSVLVRGKVVGQTDDIYLVSAKMKVNRRELLNHLNSPTKAKTRNTFISGIVSPSCKVTSAIKVAPGSVTDVKTGKDVSSYIGTVRLGPDGIFRATT